MEEYSIYAVDLGSGKGHEQSRTRPAIIVKAIAELDMCIVIPLTSNLSHLSLPYTVPINKTNATNLRDNSVALVFQIRAIDKSRLSGNQIGMVEKYQVDKIKNSLKELLNLNV